MSQVSGRALAARVLYRVDHDSAFAAAALAAEIERHPQLDERERALGTEIVYGALRSKAALLSRLERATTRGLGKTDALVVSHLLVAAYQILVLTRVPAFAAVDAAVEQVRAERGAKVAGFVNAVLRKLAASGEVLERGAAVLESVPEWLLATLTKSVGQNEARALVGASEGPPPAVCIRVRLGATLEPFENAEHGRVSPLARLLRGRGDPRRDPSFREGAFVVQEEGAQLVGLALGARPGERVLDACAGRGQKSSLLREQVGSSGELWAADLHPRKLRALRDDFARLSLGEPKTSAVDWTRGTAEVPADFDRVLVDAPCTGTGTLRRRPEILARLGPADPAQRASLAEAILRSAVTRARSGGRVVFAVCSVLEEEAEAVVQRVSDVLQPAPFDAPEATAIAGSSSSFRLLPLAHGTDGYFVASFARK
jgi:16S rRNA (cytosine967-C5)-methyltransferase